MFEISERLKKLPPYLFVEIDKAKRKARAEGRDIIDLGIGDPDEPTPRYVIDSLYKASLEPANHRYALDQGMPVLREEIMKWYLKRFSVKLNTENEILPLIGSKEGIAHFPLAFLNPGDYSLVPDPCYPPYKGGTIFAGGIPYLMPLLEKNDFLPDLSAIPEDIRKKSRIMYFNYPNNPTSAVADRAFYLKVVEFCKKYNIIAVSDLAYSEISFDGYRPLSFLQVEGAKEVGVEFHSLSKTCNMTGWRVGWACGNKDIIAGLAKVKSNIDSGIFSAIQVAAVSALENSEAQSDQLRSLYQERRDILADGLLSMGWSLKKPSATFYVWARTPAGKSSIEFAKLLLDKADIVATPGVGFGESAEGYVRFALTVNKYRMKEAVERMKKIW